MASTHENPGSGFMSFLKHPLLILIVGGAITYGVGEAIKSSYQEASSKGAFSLQITRTAWKRLFWTRAVLQRVRLKAPREAVEVAWERYITASEGWNTDLMGNLQLLDRYYPGSGKRQILQGEIQPRFGKINDELVQIVYSVYSGGPEPSPGQLDRLKAQIDDVNRRLYAFTSDMETKF